MTTSRNWINAIAIASVLWLSGPGQLAAQADGAAAPDPSVDARLDALHARLAEQERINAEQKQELEAMKAQAEQAAADADAMPEASESSLPLFRLYGFADVGLQRNWGGFFDTGLAQSDALNFVLGNVNVYFDATPLEHFRMLTEVRFMTLPNGAENSDSINGDIQRQNTSIFDPTSSTGGFLSISWGAILLERAQMEWNPSDWINVRVGYFLTPVGIWNIDHGSPTRIMLRPPVFISVNMIPERQTGIELHGRVHLMPWELGYSAYVSNGRTFGTVDYSDDKAVGGRLILKTRRPFPMQFGGSVYYGSSQDYLKEVGVSAAGVAALVRRETVSLHELIGALDVSLDLDALRVRGELIVRRLVYDEGKREVRFGIPAASQVQSAAYLMLAYQLPWLGLEPLVQAEYMRQPQIQFGENIVAGSAGFNVYFNSALTFRFQYTYGWIVDIQKTSVDHSHLYLHVLATRLIMAY